MNRSRARRMLCHLVMEWESVQLEVSDCLPPVDGTMQV